MADVEHKVSAEFAAITPEIWSSKFVPTLKQKLVFASTVRDDYDGEIQAQGDTVNVSTIPQFAGASEITEGTPNDAIAVTVGGQQILINKLVALDYKLTKRAQIQSLDVMNNLRDLAIFAIMKKMEQDIIAAIVPSAAPDHTIAYTTALTLALVDMLAAKELLDASDVEDDGMRYMAMGAGPWNDVFNITGLTSRDFVNSSPNETGALPGTILGFNPRMTNLLGTTTVMYQSWFMAVATQRGLDVKVYDPGVNGERGVRVNVDTLYGVKQLSDLRVVTID